SSFYYVKTHHISMASKPGFRVSTPLRDEAKPAKTLMQHAREVAASSVQDKKARLESSLLTNAIYTGLNVAVSAIPFGKALIDDATAMRVTQSLTGDKNFRILSDQVTPLEMKKQGIRQAAGAALQRNKLLAAVRGQIESGQSQRAQKTLQVVEQGVRRAAQGTSPQAQRAKEFLDVWMRATRLAAHGTPHPVLENRRPPPQTKIIRHPAFADVVARHKRLSERKAA
ncbi:MAG: hypothetical protein Q8P02_03900, partial [Candidatus Micrarchaeota archaeon]|nr:hypothetical protein [Candidatus Micrarchaeota archaeon]